LYSKVCEDIIKCLQILPKKSVLYEVYTKAIGASNMKVLNSFANLPMYNFGVKVQTEMDETEKAYLEQNINQALAQKEIDLEDAIAIRQLRDIDQAERLLIIRRKKRMRSQQEMAQQNSQMQAQANQQTVMASAQAKAQEIQMQSQAKIAEIQADSQAKAQLLQLEYQLKSQLKTVEGTTQQMQRKEDMDFRAGIERQKEDRKDERVKKQAVEQSKMISQRQGKREELTGEGDNLMNMLTS
jgi:hypothetical protein